jgi:serine/threonine-protein kinase
MGIVYLAEDPGIGRQVAIKVLQIDPQTRRDLRDEVQHRFEIEARSAGTLAHPNIVTIHDIGKEGDAPYIAMEYVDGESLEDVLRSGRRLTFKEVSDLSAQLCRALDYAHAHGIVHRDIKPANILLGQDGQPKIVDFGVAKMGQALNSEAPRLTRVGTIIGTPAYMSPEQVTGHDVVAASDQFSLAVIVYEMLTGRVPFEGEGATTVMYQIVHGEPASLRGFDKRLPGRLDGAIFQALAKDPAKRYPSCAAFAQALREVLQSAPDTSESEATSAAADAAAAAPGADAAIVTPPSEATIVMPPSDATIVMPPSDATIVMPPSDATIVMPPDSAPPALDGATGSITPPAAGDATIVVPPPVGAAQPSRHDAAASSTAGASATIQAVLGRLQALPRAALGAGAGGVLVVLVLMAWLFSGSGSAPIAIEESTVLPAMPLAPEQAEPEATSWWLRVAGDRGAEVWVDGENTWQTSPCELELVGRPGDIVALELRRDGRALATTELRLGAYMPSEWPIAPTASTRRADGATSAASGSASASSGSGSNGSSSGAANIERFEIVSRPAGATVRVDGSAVEGATPLSVPFEADRRYQIVIELPGHEPVRWAFTPSQLPEQTRESHSLFFPLARAGGDRSVGDKVPGGGSWVAAGGGPIEPMRVRGSRMTPAEVVRKWEPDLPRWAREAGLQSYVILELVIDRQGELRSANVLQSVHPDLERMAIEAVRRWRFRPATREGSAVDAYFNVSVQFQRN